MNEKHLAMLRKAAIPAVKPDYTVLSLGWGVQSTTLALMMAKGVIPRADVILHSDTTHESVLTYQYAAECTPYLRACGLNVVTVQPKDPRVVKTSNTGTRYTHIPVFVEGKGMMQRQCTRNWKIEPQRKWVRENVAAGAQVVWQLGISLDEWERMAPHPLKNHHHAYPLIAMGMDRQACKNWLIAHEFDIPPKSACVFCPYHGQAEWKQVADVPEDRARAIAADQELLSISWGREGRRMFIHRSEMLLADVFASGQADFYDVVEGDCSSGHCWH